MATETELVEHIRIDGAEIAESKLGRIAGAAGRVAHAFQGVGEIASVFGGIGAAWKLAEGIHDAHELHGAVARIAKINHVAAAEAHGLFDVFEMAGVGMEGAETVMMSMARMAGRIGGSIAVGADEAQKLRQMMTGLGVDAKAGIVEQMIQMSIAAQKGKIGLQDLTSVFGVGRTQAQNMLLLLQKGPENIREVMKATASSGGVINEAAIANYERMQQTRRELMSAWNDVVLILYKSMVPAVTAVLNSIKHLMEGIAPIAERIGHVLSEHMETVVALTKVWVGLIAANKVANMFSPEGAMGLLGKQGRLAQLGGGALELLAGTRFGRSRSMDFFEARDAFPKQGSNIAGAVAGVAPNMFQMAGGPMGRILSSSIGRIGILAVALGVIAKAFHMIWTNADGVRDRLGALIGGIFGSVMKFVTAMKPVLDLVANVVGGVITVAAKALLWIVERVLQVVSGIAALLGWMADKLTGIMDPNVGIGAQLNKASGGAYAKMSNQAEAKKMADDAARGAGTGKGATINQDFRGSKFEIQNNFPEGVDGGRVAVAFGDELAALGERRLDSGLRPLYSYR